MRVRSKKSGTTSQAQLARAAEFAIEALEARQLLSVTLNNAGLLTVTGNTGNDQILISLSKPSAAVLCVWVDGVRTAFATSSVKDIQLFSVGGNSDMEVRQANGNVDIPITMFGGAGNDTLIGGAGTAALYGSTGNDLIIAGSGSTMIAAGGGNNTILAQNNDVIRAAGGNNIINTGGTPSAMVLGSGKNTINTGLAALMTPMSLIKTGLQPKFNNPTVIGYDPLQLDEAYSIPTASAVTNGAGETIVIVDAFDDPNAMADLNAFSTQFGLPLVGPSTFQTMYQNGGTTPPAQDPTGGWETEESLDIEWAHAAAPNAKIVLYEANSDFSDDLYATTTLGANLIKTTGGVLSMSWGGDEGPNGITSAEETSEDALIFGNAAYSKITFIASAGDIGAELSYPAMSPYVVSVGGTSLTLGLEGQRLSESAWTSGGGGLSEFEAPPSYQAGLGYSKRAAPDLAFDADPNTGVAVFDSVPDENDDTGWEQVGGTSFGSPFFGGLTAVLNQLRFQKGNGTIGSGMLTAVYNLGNTQQNTDFFDVISGSQIPGAGLTGHSATTGFDLTTGWGVPIVSKFDSDLSGTAVAAPFVFANVGITWSGSFIEPWSDDSFNGNSIISSFSGNGIVAGSGGLILALVPQVAYNTNPTDTLPIFNISGLTINGSTVFGSGSVTVSGPDETDTLNIVITGTIGLVNGLPHISGQIYTVDPFGNRISQGTFPDFEASFSGGG